VGGSGLRDKCHLRLDARFGVITTPTGEDERFVVTAYFTKNIKPGMNYGKAESLLRSRGEYIKRLV
jgi:hypothetical protein